MSNPNGRFSVLVILVVLGLSGVVSAQGIGNQRVVPKEGYFQSFQPFYDGEYRTAARGFRNAAKTGVRSTVGRWVDSICYHTMMGDSYFHMGELPLALEQYNSALKLYLAHQNWMLRIKFPPTIQPTSASRTRYMNWGQSRRNVQQGQFPDTMMSLQGQNPEQAIREGGAVSSPNFYPLNVKEVNRCIALAMRRRTALMGPTCKHSALTGQLLAAFSRKPVPPNHWSTAWANVHTGLAYRAAGRKTEAISEFSNSLVVLGRYDHPLTATALLQLGELALEQGNHEPASNLFLEATFSAAAFGQFDIMQEAFSGGYAAHRISGKDGVYPPLERGALWARRQNARTLEAALFMLSAENFLALGNAQQADALLAQARRVMLRRDMQNGDAGARFQYLTAQLNYQVGQVPAGDSAFSAAMQYLRKGSRQRFHIALADRLYVSNSVTDRVAMSLYDELLPDAAASDWAFNPMETLATTTAPNFEAMEHWFEVAIARKEFNRALEISDQVRRKKFFSTLPMGGRLLALRWILEAPEEALDNEARLQRQDLQLKYANYAALSKQAGDVRLRLRKLPLAPGEDAAERKLREGLFADWASGSAAREAMLREMALRPEPTKFVFPPLRTFKEMQAAVGEGEIVLSFFSTKRSVYAFAYSRGKYTNWKVDRPVTLKREIAALLKQMGNVEKNVPLRSGDLDDDKWKLPAERIMTVLTKQIKPQAWQAFDQLVIVPDGLLWYVPFQALQIRLAEDKLVRLSAKTKIRLVPTVSLAHPDGRGRLADPQSAVVWGPLFPKGDAALEAAALQRLEAAVPGLVRIPDKLDMPGSLIAPLCDRLLIMRDLDEKAQGPYGWSPLVVERGKPGSDLANWMELPWGGPRQMILPGFHTPAEDALRRGASGDEIFLAACGMMACGTRTILLSRWRVGGQTSQDLVREFVQELPHTSAANAWQRSLDIVSGGQLNPDLEPRLKLDANPQDELTARHPFFWAGYMLIDSGSQPK